jgi:hypothetical protein
MKKGERSNEKVEKGQSMIHTTLHRKLNISATHLPTKTGDKQFLLH